MAGCGSDSRLCGAACHGSHHVGALINSDSLPVDFVALINSDGDPEQARKIATKLKVKLLTSRDDLPKQNPPSFLLQLTSQGLSIHQTAMAGHSPVFVDFVGGKAAYRRGQSELIAKAVGIPKLLPMTVADATAGLGRDAFVLASRGCEVTMIERHPLICALLDDGLQRALADTSTRQIAEQLKLIQFDAVSWLEVNGNSKDVVYLDPMFPATKKSAAVKKEMQLLHGLLSDQPESPALLEAAMHCAKRRVVVKRGLKSEPLRQSSPSYTVKGRSTRFDVYLIS